VEARPSSSSELIRPLVRTVPSVAVTVPAIRPSSVLLPAPLRPMTPSVSPRPTSNETSRSAQNSSLRRESREKSRSAAVLSVVCP
jgi:hypothetical protein